MEEIYSPSQLASTAVVFNNDVGESSFFVDRPLSFLSADKILGGESLSLCRALLTLPESRMDDDNQVEPCIQPPLKHKSRFYHCHGLAAPLQSVELSNEVTRGPRMHDGIYLLNEFRVSEDRVSNVFLVELSVERKGIPTQESPDPCADFWIGLGERLRDVIGIENRNTKCLEHAADCRLSTSDSTGNTDSKHGALHGE